MTPVRRFTGGCVASPHALASEAGAEVLASGGNAIDAAVAVNLMLGVVAPYTCGFGGDLFALVWDGSSLHAYNGSGRAPAAATAGATRDACGQDTMPRFGPHTVTVPGAVQGWFDLLDRFGTRTFEELSARPLRHASEGFVPSEQGARLLRAGSARTARGPWAQEWKRVYGRARAGRRFRQPELARTISAIRDGGPDAFYRGEIAQAIGLHLQDLGALLEPGDLATHHGDWVMPLSTGYRDVEVVELPPNTQGVTALQILRIVDGLGLPARDSAGRVHLLAEACKLALLDRDAHVTDPEHMRVDAADLFSDAWTARRRAAIGERALDPSRAGAAEAGTAYMCAVDAGGMAVSLIQSNFRGFGSGVTVPAWGINLQNRGSSFSLDPEHVNVIAGAKRPMHTLIPAMALRGRQPWLVFGTMGGHGQAQTHLQLLTRWIDDGMDLQEGIDAPRWMVDPEGWTLELEGRFDPALAEDLRGRGHRVNVTPGFSAVMGHAHAIAIDNDGYAAASDPRCEGAALGV